MAPGRQEVRLLDALSPGTARFAVHVHARQGRIAAAVRDQQVEGLTPLGADWVPAARPPARSVRVPGVPGGGGERHLQVVAPGTADGIVRVRLVSESGAFTPAGLDVIEVRAGSVTDVDIAQYAGGEPVTVELESDVPVTAGVLARVTGETGDLAEIAYAAAADPLTPQSPGVVPDVRGGRDGDQHAAADGSAPARPSSSCARSRGTRRDGEQRPRCGVSAGTQVAVDLATVSDAAESFALAVVPQPGSGPVLAVRQVDETRHPRSAASPAARSCPGATPSRSPAWSPTSRPGCAAGDGGTGPLSVVAVRRGSGPLGVDRVAGSRPSRLGELLDDDRVHQVLAGAAAPRARASTGRR